MEVADHLTCLLGNLYVDKKQQLELDIGLRTGKLGKEYDKAVCILSPCLFNLYAEYIMQNAQPDES